MLLHREILRKQAGLNWDLRCDGRAVHWPNHSFNDELVLPFSVMLENTLALQYLCYRIGQRIMCPVACIVSQMINHFAMRGNLFHMVGNQALHCLLLRVYMVLDRGYKFWYCFVPRICVSNTQSKIVFCSLVLLRSSNCWLNPGNFLFLNEKFLFSFNTFTTPLVKSIPGSIL